MLTFNVAEGLAVAVTVRDVDEVVLAVCVCDVVSDNEAVMSLVTDAVGDGPSSVFVLLSESA